MFTWLRRLIFGPAPTEDLFPGATKASLVLYELRRYPSFTLPRGALAEIARKTGASYAYVSKTAHRHGYCVAKSAA